MRLVTVSLTEREATALASLANAVNDLLDTPVAGIPVEHDWALVSAAAKLEIELLAPGRAA